MHEEPKSPLLDTVFQTINSLELQGDASAVAALAQYAAEVIDWNQKTNLTGAKDVHAFVRGPLRDALTLARVLLPHGHLVDVGSGAGLPGLPAKLLAPQLTLTLAEPRSLRVDFLTHVLRVLGVSAGIVKQKDTLLPAHGFDGAVAQAVWPPLEWLTRATRLLRPSGVAYVLTSTAITKEALSKEWSLEDQFHFVDPATQQTRFAYRCRLLGPS